MIQSLRSSYRRSPGFSMPRATEVRSILVIHQGALGDFILALPILRTFRKTFPNAKSVIMGYPRILELVDKRVYADEIISVDQKGMASFFVRGGDLDPNLAKFFSTFDVIAFFGKDAEGTVLSNLKKVGAGGVLHVNSFPPWNERIHLTDHLLRELRRSHFSTHESVPRLFLKSIDQAWGRSFCRKKGLTDEERSRAVVLHPGSGSKKKTWPVERFLDLVRCLQERFASPILMVLGPAEGAEIQQAIEAIQWDMGVHAPILLRGLSLLGLASVMEGCKLYIGNDSGITHMAAALGLPTVAIFGPTDPVIWCPRGKRVAVVRAQIPCSPCSQETFFQCQNAECLRAVGVKDVLECIEGLGISE